MTQINKMPYTAPTLTVSELLTDVITASVGAKYMSNEWNVMDIENN